MPLTEVHTVSTQHPDPQIIREAADVLRRGGLVAFPTETVYGLGADALNPSAVQKVFDAKQRPNDNPLIVHIAEFAQLEDVVTSVPQIALTLAQTFWPGPLTMVFERSAAVPDNVTANLDTVAIRMPDHAVTQALIKEFGNGIVGPSANVSGKPSPTKADHVYTDLNGKVDLILDAGPAEIGVESTIIDVTVSPPLVLRSGGLPLEKIKEVIGEVRATDNVEFLKRSPGTRYRHYAPTAPVIVIEEGDSEFLTKLLKKHEGKRIGCILHSNNLAVHSTASCRVARMASIEDLSHRLFDTFRQFDEQRMDIIIVETVPEKGIGQAVMDRIRKAAIKEHVY